jgi:dTDP-4-dehydrorhamnose reductase
MTPVAVDLRDFQAMKATFQQVQPMAVIHLAAQSNANYCQQEPDSSYLLNVTVACNVAGLCADMDIPCVFASTDLVFDGQHPPYREADPVSPVNRYGEQKVLAELGMLKRYPKMAVCRMPLLFGSAPPNASSFLQGFLKTLQAGQPLYLFTDEFRTPVGAIAACQGLLLALERVQGHIHLGGKERLSRYDFGMMMVEELHLPEAELVACYQKDMSMPAPRPADVSLDSTLAFKLGYAPPTLRSQLASLKP